MATSNSTPIYTNLTDATLEGGVSAIELRSFVDQELPDWLGQLDPVMAPAVLGAENLNCTLFRPDTGNSRRA